MVEVDEDGCQWAAEPEESSEQSEDAPNAGSPSPHLVPPPPPSMIIALPIDITHEQEDFE